MKNYTMKKINLVTLITKMIVACCILLAILFTMLISKYCIERNLILTSIATILFLALVCFVIFLFFYSDKFEDWYCQLDPTYGMLALYIFATLGVVLVFLLPIALKNFVVVVNCKIITG